MKMDRSLWGRWSGSIRQGRIHPVIKPSATDFRLFMPSDGSPARAPYCGTFCVRLTEQSRSSGATPSPTQVPGTLSWQGCIRFNYSNCLIHSFIHSFIHPFIHPFIHSFVLSFFHSFIHYTYLYVVVGQNPRGQNPRGQNPGGQNPSSKLRGEDKIPAVFKRRKRRKKSQKL